MDSPYDQLSWLPTPPADFAARLSAAASGSALRELSAFGLDGNKLIRLAKRFTKLREAGISMQPLLPFRLGVLSNTTTNLISPAIAATGARFGFDLEVLESEYNQIAQAAFEEHTAWENEPLDAILLAIDYRGLPITPAPGDQATADRTVEGCISYIKSIIARLHSRHGAKVILANVAPPPECLMGSFERRLPGTLHWMIAEVNRAMDGIAAEGIAVVDVAGLASAIGLNRWHDPTYWNLAKLPFSQVYVPAYADFVCRIIAAWNGKNRRCLVMDLDNTLWGGVIGDDGLEGIRIGHGDATGEAHLSLQQLAMDLRHRGIVLAVSSKNEDAAARLPFREHPDMCLREEHIAVFQANWTDKASNIRAIAVSLSLGLESLVFIDDNPAERFQVRSEIPEVAVPELPADPALYGRTLLAAGYFDAVTFSEEDKKRAGFYQQNTLRAELMSNSSMDDYLISLQMELTISPFDAAGRPRITQLVSKSNQFNLTTRRYSSQEIEAIQQDSNCFARQFRLSDRFGDNGMISILIVRKQGTSWTIDTWLMSCRVLGRHVEIAVLNCVVESAKTQGVTKLLGTYIPTSRNALVRDHYQKLGFVKIEGNADAGEKETWKLDVTSYELAVVPMEIRNAL